MMAEFHNINALSLMIMQTAYNLAMRHILSISYTHKHGLTLFIKEDGQLGMI